MVEKSVATPDVADAASSQTPSAIQSAAKTVKETAKNTVQKAAEAAPAAVSRFTGGPSRDQRSRGTGDAGTFQEPKPSKILYVGNLFFEVKAPQLQEHFSRFGNIVNVKIAEDAKGLSKGYAVIS